MKECVESDPKTYQYATLYLKQIDDLANFFPEQGGSFPLKSKQLRNKKNVGMIAVKKILKVIKILVKI